MSDFTGIPITHPPGAHPTRRTPTREEQHAVEEFESVFIAEMLAPMFEGLNTDGLGGGGDGEQMFRPMLIQQYAAALAKSGGIGLAQSVLGELTRMQIAPTEGPDGSSR